MTATPAPAPDGQALEARLAEVLAAHEWRPEKLAEYGRSSAHNSHQYDAWCAICVGDIPEITHALARVVAAGAEALDAVGLAAANDVLPDGRVDHRGHLRDELVGDGTSTCLDCTSDDGDDPWVTWTIPYDVDGKPMPKDWRTMRYADVLALCGMNEPRVVREGGNR